MPVDKHPRPDVARCFLALSLSHVYIGGSRFGEIQAQLSTVGEGDDLLKHWDCKNGALSASQATDLLSWVELAVNAALLRYMGVQAELPLA